MRLILGTFAVLVWAGCASPPALTPQEYARQFGGEVAEYQRLAAMTDCSALSHEITRRQNNFEDTGDNEWDGYHEAASQRYEELGCTAPAAP